MAQPIFKHTYYESGTRIYAGGYAHMALAHGAAAQLCDVFLSAKHQDYQAAIAERSRA